MRLAWIISIVLHTAVIGGLYAVQRAASKGFRPPEVGGFRIGVSSASTCRFDSRGTQTEEWPSPPSPTSDEDPQPIPLFDIAPLLTPPETPTPRGECVAELPGCAPSRGDYLRVAAPSAPEGGGAGDVVPSQASSATGGGAASTSQGASGPVCSRQNAAPRYPDEARRKKWEGTVRVGILIGVDGRCKAARVVESSGYACLDEAALECVRGWTFDPATQDGAPVEVEVTQPVRFVLQ